VCRFRKNRLYQWVDPPQARPTGQAHSGRWPRITKISIGCLARFPRANLPRRFLQNFGDFACGDTANHDGTADGISRASLALWYLLACSSPLAVTKVRKANKQKSHPSLTPNDGCCFAFRFFGGCDSSGRWLAHRSSGRRTMEARNRGARGRAVGGLCRLMHIGFITSNRALRFQLSVKSYFSILHQFVSPHIFQHNAIYLAHNNLLYRTCFLCIILISLR
jgi:hypothetical protein